MRRAMVCLTVLCALPVAAFADPVQVTSRMALDSQTIAWSAYGSAGTALSTPDAENFGGVTAQIGSSAGIAEVRQEGTDFTGNFHAGDTLLGLPDGFKSDVFGIRFSGAPVYGVGTQIEAASGFTGAFTGYMDLYSATSALLGEISVTGDATGAEDGSAAFIGAISSVPIAYVRFLVGEGNPFFPREGDLAINQLSLLDSPIPEPAALLLFGPALLAFAARAKGRVAG